MFDLRIARYFIALGEELHYGRAAERLHMSQPPLSQAIIRLERTVGTQLVERNSRRVSLTPAGLAFLEECRALVQQAQTALLTPRLVASGASSTIAVGTVATAFTWPLPEALDAFRKLAPEVSVEVREVDSEEVLEGLTRGWLDVALGRLSTAAKGIQTRVLVRDEFVALLPAGHPLADPDTRLDLADLAEELWIWLAREISPDYHDAMTSACRAAGFAPQPRHWVKSIASQLALVSTGVGVTIIPHTAERQMPPGVVAVPLRRAAPAVVLSASSKTAPAPAVQAFTECVVRAVSNRHAAAGAESHS